MVKLMIREKAILFKLNLINISDKQLIDSVSHSYEICPGCGAKDCCGYHGSYERALISINDGMRTDEIISIDRVLCSSCESTHALLPDILIPYGSYSLRFVLYVLRKYIERDQTVNALCNFFCIAVTTLYKWIHLFNEHTNLLLNAIEQISWVKISALDFIEEITCFPSHFFDLYNFSFLENIKQRAVGSTPG